MREGGRIIKMPGATDKDLRRVAEANGCTPIWADGIFGWKYHCGCEDGLHASDQQCSVLTLRSAAKTRKAEGE